MLLHPILWQSTPARKSQPLISTIPHIRKGYAFDVLLGFGFMFSPVVSALGVGFLGLEFYKGFPLTVTAAHMASVSLWAGSQQHGWVLSIALCWVLLPMSSETPNDSAAHALGRAEAL